MSLGPTRQGTSLQCQELAPPPRGAVGQEGLWGQAAPPTLRIRTGCTHGSLLSARVRASESSIPLSFSLCN